MIQREETPNTTAATTIDRPSTVRESDLRTRLKTFPRDAQSWYSLGSLLRSVGNFEEAESSLRRAISLNPGPTHFWDELARILMDLGRLEEAYQLYDGGTKRASFSIKKELEDFRQLERKIDAEETSPCIACSDYSYYGCSKGKTCDAIIRWRSRAQHLSIQNQT
ncbi:MAG: tetratricopeptide repeat protein [Candidatus Thorarchaeota archaeon]|nr:MAG: tetratricopeptide repeat protein [Candidatus Thorarchaeota archaeon]